ncbi:MAG: ABC transporter permease [Candidatus Nanopelagicales bacterium]
MWRHVWLIARLGVRRSLRDRSILIMALVAPIAIAVVVGAAFGGGASVSATIGVANEDRSDISAQIAQSLTNAGGDGIAFATVSEPAQIDALLDAGTYDAVLVLPAGLGDAVLTGDAADLQVVGRAAEPLATSIAQSVAQGVAANLQTARVTAAAATTAGLPDVGAAVQKAVETQSPIAVDQGQVQGTFSVMAYFAPGMAMLFLFFVIGEGARSIVAERREGTLQRILAGPVSPSAVLLGKTAHVMIVGVVSMSVVWLITWLAFGASWGDPLGVFLVIVAAVAAIAGISLFITGIARTENQADALTTMVALLFAILGGTFFYGAAGPLVTMQKFTPNGQALAAFVELSAAQATVVEIAPRILLLLGIGIGMAAVGLLTMRNKVLA